MATVFRGPTFASPQRKPPQPTVFYTTGMLVPALLLSGAVPFKTADVFVTPQHPSHALSANLDTSRGVPKTLYADAAKAFANQPNHSIPRPHGVVDTSAGSPRALLSPATSAPFFNPPGAQPQARRAVLADTSRGTFNLPDDAVAIAQQELLSAPHLLRIGSETSKSTPQTLFPQPAAPSVSAIHTPPQAWKWWNLDTSRGTAKVLYADSVAPFLNPAQPVLDRLRPVADTTQDTPLTLLIQPAPVVPPPSLRVDFNRDLRDTSQSIPLTLVPAGPAPFVSPLSLQVDRRLDIRLDVPANLAIQTPGIQPFAQYDWPAPIEYRSWFESRVEQQAQPDTIPPPLAVVPVVPEQTGGGANKYAAWNRVQWERKREEPVELAPTVIEAGKPPRNTKAGKPIKVRLDPADKVVAESLRRIREAQEDEAIVKAILDML